MRVATLEQYVLFGAHHEEGQRECEGVKALEIDITAIHHIEGTGFNPMLVEGVDIVHFAIGNADKSWDIAMQVEQRVHLDGALALAKSGPRKQRQTQIDGGRIESVKALIEIDADRIGGIQRPGYIDQDVREIGKDAPVARFVGVGQSGAGNLTAKAQMV